MVSTLSIICMVITLLLSLALPIVIFVWYGLKQKKKEVWIAGVFGAGGFALMQLGIRLPIVNTISDIPAFLSWAENNYIWYCFVLAFTAGLFEVVARYGGAKILYHSKSLTKELTFETGVMAGIGHGGIEAVALIGATYINNLLFAAMINTGMWSKFLATIQEASVQTGDSTIYETYASILPLLSETPSYLYLAAGYERVLTMAAHTAMTLIVFYFVAHKKDAKGVLIALAIHTALDFFVVLISGLSTAYLGNVLTQDMAYAFMYVMLTVVAVASVVVIFKIKGIWKTTELILANEEPEKMENGNVD